MKPLTSAMILILGTLLAGCGSDPVPVDEPKQKRVMRVDPFQAQAERALFKGNPADVSYDREQLRTVRASGQKGDAWPVCEKVSSEYSRAVVDTKTMMGVQDALLASQVDDFVLCDKPTIYSATRAAAETAIARLEPQMPARQMVEYLLAHPSSGKMDDCWLKSLRDSRKDGFAYTEAMERAEARCKPLPR